MKLAIAFLILVSLAIAVALARPWRGGGNTQVQSARPEAATTSPSQTSLGVDDLMRNIDRHRGPVTVVGVVSASSADKQAVTLIDTKEFAECGVTNCASLALPVRWAGPAPAVEKKVRVNGEVRESDGKLVFVATALEEVSQ